MPQNYYQIWKICLFVATYVVMTLAVSNLRPLIGVLPAAEGSTTNFVNIKVEKALLQCKDVHPLTTY